MLSVIPSGITEPVQLDTDQAACGSERSTYDVPLKSLHLSLPNRHQKVLIHNPPPLPLRASLDKRKTALFQRCSAIIQCSQACLGVTKQFAFSVCCSWYRYEFEKSARGRERGKERAHRFSALRAAGYQLLFTLRIERCVVLRLLINLLLTVGLKERLIQWRTSRLLLLESRLVLKLRAAGGWKCRKIILSLPVCSSWVRGAFMTTDFIFIFSYLLSSREIDSEGFRPMVEKGRAEMEDHRTYFHSHCPSVIKCLDWDQQKASTVTQNQRLQKKICSIMPQEFELVENY